MSVYYNTVGEGWFKKVNNVVNEAKYSVDDMNITYRKNEVNGMKKLEIEIDEMDENSKEVKDFLSKFLDKNDVYAAQDVIHDYIKGLKNKDVDEVYIAFESKYNVVNEENNNYIELGNKYLKEIKNVLNELPVQTLKNALEAYKRIIKINKIESEDDYIGLVDDVLVIKEIWDYEKSIKTFNNIKKLEEKYEIEDFIEKTFK